MPRCAKKKRRSKFIFRSAYDAIEGHGLIPESYEAFVYRMEEQRQRAEQLERLEQEARQRSTATVTSTFEGTPSISSVFRFGPTSGLYWTSDRTLSMEEASTMFPIEREEV